jgi:hypothetical protein
MAMAMRSYAQLLPLLARRLQALPRGPLSLIARATGRPSRRASKLLLHTYGPLDCGLLLDGTDDLKSVLATLDKDRCRYTHISAVSFDWSYASYPAYGTCSDFLTAIPTAFPRLQSLSLPAAALHTACQPSLSHLTALSSSLTSLTVPCGRGLAAALQRMQPLTHLRALTVTGMVAPRGTLGSGVEESPEGFQQFIDELNKLPQLQHLQLCDTHHRYQSSQRPHLSAAAHLPSLRCADSLTHLACGLHLVDWDEAAIRTLSSGLPCLSSLALSFFAHPAPDAAAAILDAVAQQTALTALDLDTDSPCSFQPLSSLRLGSCRMQLGGRCDTASLLEALAVQRSLTQLRLDCINRCLQGALTAASLPHLTRMADTLVHLDLAIPVDPAANLLEAVGKLSNLKALRLDHLPRAEDATWVTSDVTCLAQLRSLEVLDVRTCGAFQDAVVGSVSGLVGLKELHLWGACTSSDMWRLLPLQPHLTRLVLNGDLDDDSCEALGAMAGLRQLELYAIDTDTLHLQLPPSLRVLRLYEEEHTAWHEPTNVVVAKLRAAGRKQDCTVTIEDTADLWDKRV